jgi:glutamine cyclotransferase
MKKMIPFLCCVFFSCTDTPSTKKPPVSAPAAGSATAAPAVTTLSYSVIASFPHDTTAFTEGLLVHNGVLYESTGHTDTYPFSRSLFGVVDEKSGKIDVKAEIDRDKYFGEGIVILKDKIYQLTDTTHIGFVYDARTYKRLGEFHYAGDGWALTTNGTHLIMSDGTSTIRYRDPVSFEPVKTLTVTANGAVVGNVNELELINGFVYANQWLTSYILKIDTTSGKVVGKLDLSALSADAKQKYSGAQEMNGIAYDPVKDKVYVTGKLWPVRYEIRFEH